MYAQVAIKPNTLLRNGAYGIVMKGVQKCTRGCSSLRGRKRLPLCCIKLDTATDACLGGGNMLFGTHCRRWRGSYQIGIGRLLPTAVRDVGNLIFFRGKQSGRCFIVALNDTAAG